jgi:hypothetical protein
MSSWFSVGWRFSCNFFLAQKNHSCATKKKEGFAQSHLFAFLFFPLRKKQDSTKFFTLFDSSFLIDFLYVIKGRGNLFREAQQKSTRCGQIQIFGKKVEKYFSPENSDKKRGTYFLPRVLKFSFRPPNIPTRKHSESRNQ